MLPPRYVWGVPAPEPLEAGSGCEAHEPELHQPWGLRAKRRPRPVSRQGAGQGVPARETHPLPSWLQ